MNRDNTSMLYQRYPILFRGRSKPFTESLMGFGCECGDGWFDLIDALCHDLIALCVDQDLAVPAIIQVKEKFGSLRVYLEAGDPVLFERIAQAEEASLETCERCGGPGQLGVQDDYWCVRCEICAAAE